MMQDTINQFKNKLFIFSVGLGLVSCFAWFNPNTNIKNLSKIALGFSLASLAIGEISSSMAVTAANKFKQETDDVLRQNMAEAKEQARKLQSNIDALTHSVDKISIELSQALKEKEQLKFQITESSISLVSQHKKLEVATALINDLKLKLRDVGRFSTDEAHKMVRDTYNRCVRKLEAHIGSLMRNYSPIADDFNDILIEIDKFRSRYSQKLNEYDNITAFNELIDIGLDMQEKIINGCIELRVKGQTLAIRYLNELTDNQKTLLDNSVGYGQYESDVTNLIDHTKKTIQELKDENESEVRAVANDWLSANNQHIYNYTVNYSQLIEDGKEAIAALIKRDSLIAELQAKIEDLEKPWTFAGTIDYAMAGNSIISFYHLAYGYILDAIAWQETETGYTLTFNTVRNKVYLTADMLHDKDNRPQLAGLTNSLQLPTFTPNYQSGLMVLEVITRKPPKKQFNEKDISKLWRTSDKFEEIVKNWSRIRITGGSESGKSPTAENIACVILKYRPGTAKLYNPQHNSQKNYWSIPVIGSSHKESEKAIAALALQIDARSNGTESREVFELSLFDEIDSTMSHTHGKKSDIGGNVNFIIKQASHQNLGAIFIGQNANVSEYPGMERSDWNSAVNIHIGINANDALTNTNVLTTSESERLKEKVAKLIAFCASKNEELGLDDKHDINAYRFALVMEPSKQPYFIELPAYGVFSDDSVPTISVREAGREQAGEALKAGLDGSNTDSTVAGIRQDLGYVGLTCPKCQIGTLALDGKSKGVNYYICGQCEKKTSENVLRKQNSHID
ncbi:MAG: hypothetical protein H0X31_00090 [Nostocaceae cyanobacterium]|nr:hypothetical protein [Nostocaceae cyanobacterium]